MDYLKTQNEAYGFFGSMSLEGRRVAEQAWPIAMAALTENYGHIQEAARYFLDSRRGRQFADTVRSEMSQGKDIAEAIKGAEAIWNGCKDPLAKHLAIASLDWAEEAEQE